MSGLNFSEYTLDSFKTITKDAFNSIAFREIDGLDAIGENNFYSMFGFDPLNNKTPKEANDFLNNDVTRSYRLTTFWENTRTAANLGIRFSETFQSDNASFDFGKLNTGNILVTYLTIFIFKANLTLINSIVNEPINITNNITREKFSIVIDNIKIFLNSCRGLGNINFEFKDGSIVTQGPKTNSAMNTGFIQKYCQHVEESYCIKYSIEGENCTTRFRHEMSNNKQLSNLCGCYAPLPEWLDTTFKNSKIKGPRNRCDYFCFQLNTYKLVNKPGTVDSNSQSYQIGCQDSTICVMDLDNINIHNNEGGNILFEQICNCPSGMLCQCFLEVSDQGKGLLDNVTDSRGRGILSEINYRQSCSTTTCYSIDDDGNQSPEDCNKVSTPRSAEVNDENNNGMTQIEKLKEVDETFWIVIVIVSIAIIIYLFTFLEITFSKNIK